MKPPKKTTLLRSSGGKERQEDYPTSAVSFSTSKRKDLIHFSPVQRRHTANTADQFADIAAPPPKDCHFLH